MRSYLRSKAKQSYLTHQEARKLPITATPVNENRLRNGRDDGVGRETSEWIFIIVRGKQKHNEEGNKRYLKRIKYNS